MNSSSAAVGGATPQQSAAGLEDVKYLALQAKLLSKIESSSKEDVKQTLIAQRAVAQQKKFKKVTGILLGAVFALVVVLIIQRLVTVYFTYKNMIEQLSKYKPSMWPTSAFNTALVVEYPGLAGWFGFSNPALPTATYFCYSTQQLWDCFKDNQTEYLARMFDQSVKGSKDATGACAPRMQGRYHRTLRT